MLLHPDHYWKVMAGLLFITLGFAILFLAIPEIDLIVSGWFYNSDTNSFMGTSWLFLTLREIINFSFNLIVIALLVLWAIALVRGPVRCVVPAWYFAFPLATILIGPGLIVNTVLKGNWGRARPEHILEFGGDKTFSAPFLMVDECARNCSFVSGEASSLATLGMLIAVIFGAQLSGAMRVRVLSGCSALIVYGCFIRIFMGRHFLSDTIFAVLFCAIILWALWGLFRMGARSQTITRHIMHNPRVLYPFFKYSGTNENEI